MPRLIGVSQLPGLVPPFLVRTGEPELGGQIDLHTTGLPGEAFGQNVPGDRFGRDSYRLDPVICPFKGTIDYKPGDFDCFLLEVPENRENPDSRFIELNVVRINSRWGKEDFEDNTEETGLEPGKRDDPVIYLTGGPGAHVTYYVKRLKEHGLLDHRDLFILEQRGIGSSGELCPFYASRKPATGDVATFEESLEANLERVEAFADELASYPFDDDCAALVAQYRRKQALGVFARQCERICVADTGCHITNQDFTGFRTLEIQHFNFERFSRFKGNSSTRLH